MFPYSGIGSAVVALALAGGPMALPHSLPEVRPNDNRTPAGERQGDTVALRLAISMATWHPETASGPGITVAALSEEGKAPEVPAPLIRVPTGSWIRATVRNALADSAVTVYGLTTHPATALDSIVIPPGDSATVRFPAGAPGTYLYWARLGAHAYTGGRTGNGDEEREQLGGAFVVDPPGPVAPDRIFVLNIWGHLLDSVTYSNALAINGRSWPYDERIGATVGDTLRWRIVNATNRPHPMHLHGFYYRVDSRGDVRADTTYDPGARELAVTDRMRRFSTFAATWSPDRPGDWIFHCHIAYHVTAGSARLDPLTPENHDAMSDDPRLHMAGLVLGIVVAPRPAWRAPARTDVRRLRLLIQEGGRRGRARRALGYVLQNGAAEPAADSVTAPGSVLVLRRGQPTDIMVVNHLPEATAVHWHGIELESWSDGVAGWSGMDSLHTAPSIQPGDSFVAHLTLPRAGTFIFHTHMNDLAQLTGGLYGAIVVLPPGRRFDPATDHVFVSGSDGGSRFAPHLLVNGDSLPAPMRLRAGATHRIRLVNIGPGGAWRYSIQRDTAAERWRAVAKDGADLPPALATEGPAETYLDVGETADFEWRPAPGSYRLAVRRLAAPAGSPPAYERQLVVGATAH
jgi:FtsP/CotA-like multicopper oxidase with cupredoxin domain